MLIKIYISKKIFHYIKLHLKLTYALFLIQLILKMNLFLMLQLIIEINLF
jgi:hypothetical protein